MLVLLAEARYICEAMYHTLSLLLRWLPRLRSLLLILRVLIRYFHCHILPRLRFFDIWRYFMPVDVSLLRHFMLAAISCRRFSSLFRRFCCFSLLLYDFFRHLRYHYVSLLFDIFFARYRYFRFIAFIISARYRLRLLFMLLISLLPLHDVSFVDFVYVSLLFFTPCWFTLLLSFRLSYAILIFFFFQSPLCHFALFCFTYWLSRFSLYALLWCYIIIFSPFSFDAAIIARFHACYAFFAYYVTLLRFVFLPPVAGSMLWFSIPYTLYYYLSPPSLLPACCYAFFSMPVDAPRLLICLFMFLRVFAYTMFDIMLLTLRYATLILLIMLYRFADMFFDDYACLCFWVLLRWFTYAPCHAMPLRRYISLHYYYAITPLRWYAAFYMLLFH